MASLGTGGDFFDGIDNFTAFGHFTEHGVTPALHILAAVVEEVVVGGIDEELRGGGVRLHGAGHGNAVLGVLQAVVSLVLNARAGLLLFHAGFEAAALNHEALDHTVENGAVVVAVLDILNEVCGGLWGFFGVQLQNDVAVVGGQFDFGHAEIRSFKAYRKIGCAGRV